MTQSRVIFDLPTQLSSELFGARLAACLQAPCVLTFKGEIGAGKTTLIRAMLRSLGINGAIKSPSFSLIESYQINRLHIHHIDLYRIHDESELDYMGFRDYFNKDAICCIEWPERAVNGLERIDMEFSLTLKGTGRQMHIQALSLDGAAMLTRLIGES